MGLCSQSEVNQFGLLIDIKDNVMGFDVSVPHLERMASVNTVQNVPKELLLLILRQFKLKLKEGCQVDSGQIL